MSVFTQLSFCLTFFVLFWFLPERFEKFTKIFAPVIAFMNFLISLIILIKYPDLGSQNLNMKIIPSLMFDNLTKLVYFFIGFFGLIISIYSISSVKYKVNKYFSYFFLTLFASYGVILSKNLILFSVFWGLTGITIYLLSNMEKEANLAAKKTLIILGASDSFLLLGIALMYKINNNFQFVSGEYSLLVIISFLIASFAKAGAMPLHTWIPDFASKSPISVTAFLPASLDKLLGIYLLVRIFYFFSISEGVKVFIMILGAITILAAVFMALSQHSGRRLLSYHAVSQVGYMVLGVGTGSIIGIAGGLFHMLNNAIYKSSLFLGLGQVEKVKGTDKLEKLGGLIKFLPFTFVSMFISSLAISGIPPLNGFYSKWLIYQGVINSVSGSKYSLIISLCIIAALFGSALTLASFVKIIHAIFLGVKKEEGIDKNGNRIKENVFLVIPQVILALSCVILGIFPNLVLKTVFGKLNVSGIWEPKMAFILILSGIVLGVVIVFISGLRFRKSKSFIGGELIEKEMYVSGVEFYTSIENLRPFKYIYKWQKKLIFDIYEVLKGIIFYFSELLSSLHTGILTNYLSWILGASIIILLLSL